MPTPKKEKKKELWSKETKALVKFLTTREKSRRLALQADEMYEEREEAWEEFQEAIGH